MTEGPLFGPTYRGAEQPMISQALGMDTISHVQSEPSAGSAVSLNTEILSLTEPAPNLMADGLWNQRWESKPEPTIFDAPASTVPTDQAFAGPYGLRKKLLRLNLDLIEDLELLEAGYMTLGSPSLLKEDIHPTVGKLDLPVFRMLNHSTQFLELLQSETRGNSLDTSLGLTSESEPSQVSPSLYEDAKSPSTDLMSGRIDDGEITAATHDSGCFSLTEQSSERARGAPFTKCDLSTSLNILATYCHLVRIYRAIFTQLYQLFLIVPPADAAAFLLLPSLQFGQFHMDGNLTVQVQVLIELGSSMLEKIERALGLSYGSPREVGDETSPVSYILAESPLASVRDHIAAQEQASGGIPLKETMNCLRQLLKDPLHV